MTFRDNFAKGNGDNGFGLVRVDRSVLEGNTSVENLRGFVLSSRPQRPAVGRGEAEQSGGGGGGFETARSDDNLFRHNRATRNVAGSGSATGTGPR